jgi:hypothetical protein
MAGVNLAGANSAAAGWPLQRLPKVPVLSSVTTKTFLQRPTSRAQHWDRTLDASVLGPTGDVRLIDNVLGASGVNRCFIPSTRFAHDCRFHARAAKNSRTPKTSKISGTSKKKYERQVTPGSKKEFVASLGS